MNQTTFLQGKVIKETLPVFDTPATAPRDVRKRLRLPQGELAQVLSGEPAIHYLACVDLLAGTTRGNHYHEQKQEFFYLISGEMALTVEDIASKQRADLICQAGDLVRIDTRIAHTLKILKAGHGIEFSPVAFAPEDVHRYALV